MKTKSSSRRPRLSKLTRFCSEFKDGRKTRVRKFRNLRSSVKSQKIGFIAVRHYHVERTIGDKREHAVYMQSLQCVQFGRRGDGMSLFSFAYTYKKKKKKAQSAGGEMAY